MKKIVVIAVVLVMMSVVSSCKKEANMMVCDNATELIKEDFYNDNYVYGATYGDERLLDETYPESRTFVVATGEEYEKIFTDDAKIEVDFTKEMLLVYTYKTLYNREIKVKKIEYNDNVIKVKLEMKKGKNGVGGAARPFQRYVVLKIEKQDVNTVDFSLNEK